MNKKAFTLLLTILMSMAGLQATAEWDYAASVEVITAMALPLFDS